MTVSTHDYYTRQNFTPTLGRLGMVRMYDTPFRQSRSFFSEMTIFSCVEAFPGSRAFLENASKLW
jgi:hypothetical protein